ncbi:MAG: Two-component sensor kinase [Parcubacteria group bacterium GW2011_GWA2_47_7]|nr:MAG: Two-component sensor kinase [Parcubacteria group bacterium GW2011_GWA2_47_7]
MTIKQKLYYSLSVNLFFISILVFVGLYGVNEIGRDFDVLVVDSIPSISHINSMSESYLLSIENAHSYVILGDPLNKEGYSSHSETFLRLLGELRQLATDQYEDNIADIAFQKLDIISVKWKLSDISARGVFDEYEKTGHFTMSRVEDLFGHVDDMTVSLSDFIDMENNEIVEAKESADTTSKSVTMLILVVGMTVIILFFIPNFFLIRSITEPLRMLDEGVKAIGEGDLSKKVVIVDHNEFGSLAKSFNQMAEDIRQSQESLELKVRGRTEELENAKLGLAAVVTERTNELAKKLEEVQSMNTMMTNRELRVIELKKEIEELKSKLDKTKV